MLATQSTKPSVFLPEFRRRIAAALGLDKRFVRLVAKPDPNKWSYQTGSLAAAIHLLPLSGERITDAGAGRAGTPVQQILQVYLRTRSLVDTGGGNETALISHYDNELLIFDALHLQHVVVGGVNQFIMPPRIMTDGVESNRIATPDGTLETLFPIRLDYVLALTQYNSPTRY